jgi:hypothetical protein
VLVRLMSTRVPSDRIEGIVGAARHETQHYARAVSAEQTVYVLHSFDCLNSGIDLRDCAFSLALDEGIDVDRWTQDEPVHVVIEDGRLVPAEGGDELARRRDGGRG